MNLFSPQQRIQILIQLRSLIREKKMKFRHLLPIVHSITIIKHSYLKKKNSKDGLVYYKENQSSNHWAYFWNQALIILMVEDRYYCRQDETLKSLITDLLNAFWNTKRILRLMIPWTGLGMIFRMTYYGLV